MTSQITLKGISKSFDRRPILTELSLTIHAGELLVIKGQNGSGKSTLLAIMAGILKPDAGLVEVSDGLKIRYVGHETMLYPSLTVKDNLIFWSTIYNDSLGPKDIYNFLYEFGLDLYENTPVSQLSRGMQQRLSLIRAFTKEPKLILLDEPDTGLDKDAQALLINNIIRAKKNGSLIALISHHSEKYESIATNMLNLDNLR